ATWDRDSWKVHDYNSNFGNNRPDSSVHVKKVIVQFFGENNGLEPALAYSIRGQNTKKANINAYSVVFGDGTLGQASALSAGRDDRVFVVDTLDKAGPALDKIYNDIGGWKRALEYEWNYFIGVFQFPMTYASSKEK
uniref:ChiA n=1 Tax=Steinernema glaseri TaxID=37863 RepID=A0A1I7XX39_9BILA